MAVDGVISKVFRVFVSSTFSDFELERNYLQQHVFPRLEELCRAHGALFQPVDLRWGITDEASLDQKTLDICLNEVRMCAEITPRPSFVILMGNRYGWIPIPTTVTPQRFETCDPSPLMREWYRLDENTSTYQLRPRTGAYVDYAQWEQVENELRRDWAQRGEDMMSATEAEIRCGLAAPWENRRSIMCFRRNLANIPLNGEGAAYCDCRLEDGAFVLDEAGVARLAAQEEFIESLLPPENIVRFDVDWAERDQVVARFCETMGERLEASILEELRHLETLDRQQAALASEAAHSQLVGANYTGHDELIDEVRAHVVAREGAMALLCGAEGKSAFCSELARRLTEAGRRAVLRHVGASVVASDAESLLASVAEQLGADLGGEGTSSEDAGQGEAGPAEDLAAGRNLFASLLAGHGLPALQATVREALAGGRDVLILDGIERLDNAAALVQPLSSLPNVVVTTGDRRIAAALPGVWVREIEPLGPAERRELFEKALASHGEDESENAPSARPQRRLTDAQAEAVETSLAANGSAAFAKLAADYAAGLASWDDPFDATTQEELAELFLDSLTSARKHAPLLTKRMFAYIALGRNGVTLPDLIGMLQRDREVFAEFNQGLYHPLCREEIPASVLSRLYYDLSPFLAHKPFMGADVVSFAYQGFKAVALERCVDGVAVENAIGYYEHAERAVAASALDAGAGVSPTVLSELPYLLLAYRGTQAALAWMCANDNLAKKLRAGLESEVIADVGAMDDLPEVAAFRAILISRIADFRRCPAAIGGMLQAEADLLRANGIPGSECGNDMPAKGAGLPVSGAGPLSSGNAAAAAEGARRLSALISAPPFVLAATSATDALRPAFALGRGVNWVFCEFSPDGSKLLGVMLNGQATLFDLGNGTFTQSVMPGEWSSIFNYACVEGPDSLVIMGEHTMKRLVAPDFWNAGLNVAAWSDVEANAFHLDAMSEVAPVTYAQVTPNYQPEVVQMANSLQADGEREHIPIDFLSVPAEVNHIALSASGSIAMAFRSGAIAATNGLFDERSSSAALMCCTYYDHDTKIAAASADGTLYLFEADGGLLERIDLSLPGIIEQHGECIVWDQERGLLYVGHRCGYLSIVKPGQGRAGLRQIHSGHRMGILSMALSADGGRLALGSRGNMEEAVLAVYDTERLLGIANSKKRAQQIFDKNISSARRAADNWYFMCERTGFSSGKHQIFKAALADPADCSYLLSADCFAVLPEKDALFFARNDTLMVLVGGEEHALLDFPYAITGMALDDAHMRLAVSCEGGVILFNAGLFQVQPGKKRLFGPSEPARAVLPHIVTYPMLANHGRIDAPIAFDGDMLYLCCEPERSFFKSSDGFRIEPIPDRKQLAYIDVSDGETWGTRAYPGFASAIVPMGSDVYVACGEGRLWDYADKDALRAGFMRSEEGAGVYRFPKDGDRTLVLEGTASAALTCSAGAFFAFDEGDILFREAWRGASGEREGHDIWLNVPAKPAAMSYDEKTSRLYVLDDGSKSGGAPQVYVFERSIHG